MLYTTNPGVTIRVTGEDVSKLRMFLVRNNIRPISKAMMGGPDLLEGVFSCYDAGRITAWLQENGGLDEDYVHDLAAESGA